MFRVKEWETFQSYKDRHPPWIRFHKRTLDNYDFQKMSADARAILPMLWLIASEDKDPVSGLLRFGYEEIAFRLRQPEKIVRSAIQETIKAGFIIDETTSYGTVTKTVRNHHSETETETETETESITRKPRTKISKPSDVSDGVWEDFVTLRKNRKAPVSNTALEKIRKEAQKAGWTMEAALSECCSRGWQGFKAEWIKNGEKNDTRSNTASKWDRSKAAMQRSAFALGIGPEGGETTSQSGLAVFPDPETLRQGAGGTGSNSADVSTGFVRLPMDQD